KKRIYLFFCYIFFCIQQNTNGQNLCHFKPLKKKVPQSFSTVAHKVRNKSPLLLFEDVSWGVMEDAIQAHARIPVPKTDGSFDSILLDHCPDPGTHAHLSLYTSSKAI